MRIVVALIIVAGGARADIAPPAVAAAAPGIRLRGADAHQAARLVAAAYRINVLVAGADRPIALDLPDGGGPAALDAIAAAAGLTHVAHGPLHLLVERALPPWRDERSRSTPMDLDLVHAGGANLARLLGDVLRLPLEGGPSGDLTVVARNVGAAALLAALVAVSGGRLERGKTGARFVGGALPASAPEGAVACAPPAEPPLTRVLLACVPVEALVVAGIARRGERRLALVQGRRGGAVVRAGDHVGIPPARVVEIADDAVTLDGGRRLAFAPR